MSEDRNLADQCKKTKEELEEQIRELLLDFTEKTGFKVNQVVASYHAPHGREPLYAVTVKVDL